MLETQEICPQCGKEGSLTRIFSEQGVKDVCDNCDYEEPLDIADYANDSK